jgi:hypothetical protein
MAGWNRMKDYIDWLSCAGMANEFKDLKPRAYCGPPRILIAVLLMGMLIAIPALADEAQPETLKLPLSGHTAKDMLPTIAPTPERQNRALPAPIEPCVTVQPGGVFPPGTIICGQVQSPAHGPRMVPHQSEGNPPIGTVMEGPGLK